MSSQISSEFPVGRAPRHTQGMRRSCHVWIVVGRPRTQKQHHLRPSTRLLLPHRPVVALNCPKYPSILTIGWLVLWVDSTIRPISIRCMIGSEIHVLPVHAVDTAFSVAVALASTYNRPRCRRPPMCRLRAISLAHEDVVGQGVFGQCSAVVSARSFSHDIVSFCPCSPLLLGGVSGRRLRCIVLARWSGACHASISHLSSNL